MRLFRRCGGVDQLAAGRQRAGDDQRLEAGAAKIDRGSIASRAGTDNHHITHITHGCYCNAVSTTVAGGFADGVQKKRSKKRSKKSAIRHVVSRETKYFMRLNMEVAPTLKAR